MKKNTILKLVKRKKMLKLKTDNLYILVYAILSLIIIFPLLNNYILLWDWIVTPNLDVSNFFYGIEETAYGGLIIITLFLKFLSFIISTSIIQKLIIFLILFLSGISMHNLIKTKSQFPRYFAAILYMINPFVYVRFIAGHWWILLAYALTPFVILSIMKFLDDPKNKQLIKTCLWISLIAAISIHTLFLILFLFAILFIYSLLKTKKRSFKPIIKLSLFFILLNTYWIIPLLTAESTVISQITSDDLSAFKTRGAELNGFMNTLMLYGFWRENAYTLPRDIIPKYIYFPIFAIILFLTIYGYLNCKVKYKTPILITGILAQLLAVGVGHPWFREIFEFLFTNFYFMRGFREPQKFIALLVFVYAFFSAYGVAALLKEIKKLKILALILIIAIPFAYTPTMFNSFSDQIHTTDYPEDWYEINTYLNQDKNNFNTLFLPWHLYMDFKWIPNKDKKIANPSSRFFDKSTIQGDNMEVGKIYTSSDDPRSKYIEKLLINHTDFADKLKLINVKYIILAKEVDYKDYLYLLNQTDLKLIKETKNLILLENTKNVNKFYQSDNPELELIPLEYKKKSSIKYEITKPDKKYIIFTEPYNKNWVLGNQQPESFKGMNIYEYKENLVLKYERFNVYLISYIISLVTLILIYLIWKNKVKINK